MPAQQMPHYRLSETGSPLGAAVQESIFEYRPIATDTFMPVLQLIKEGTSPVLRMSASIAFHRSITTFQPCTRSTLTSHLKMVTSAFWVVVFSLIFFKSRNKKELNFHFLEENSFFTVKFTNQVSFVSANMVNGCVCSLLSLL